MQGTAFSLSTDKFQIKWTPNGLMLIVWDVKKKSKAWNKYLHTRDQQDYMKYGAARNKATKATIYAKKNYERRK